MVDRVPPRAWALGVGVFVVLVGTVMGSSIPPGVWHDDGVYLLIAKSLAEGEGLRYAGIVGTPPAVKFPPLYPVVLAGLWCVGPGFPEVGDWIAAANLVFLAVAAGAFTLLLGRVTRLPMAWAAGVSAVTFLSPELWRLAAIPLSEPLFTALFLVSLVLGLRFQESGRAADGLWFLVVFWACVHVRTVGIVLLPAVAWGAWRHRWTGEALGLVMVGALGLLPWTVWSRMRARTIPEPLADVLGSYTSWLVGQVRDHPAKYVRYLGENLGNLVEQTRALVLPGPTGGWSVWALAFLLTAVVAYGVLRLWRRAPAVSGAIVLYALIVWMWPFQSIRLLVPLLPLLVLAVVAAVTGLLRDQQRVARAILVVWAVVFGVASLGTLRAGTHLEAYETRVGDLTRAAGAVHELVPDSGIIGAPELFAALHLYTGRTVSPSARFLPLAEAGPSWGTIRQQYEIWRTVDLDHVLVEHGGGVHGPPLDRMNERCPPGTVIVLKALAGDFLVRLAADEDCWAAGGGRTLVACIRSLFHTKGREASAGQGGATRRSTRYGKEFQRRARGMHRVSTVNTTSDTVHYCAG